MSRDISPTGGHCGKRFPNMLIDSCASGGRRNDLETMRLSVPLHKTDYDYADLPTKQAFHHSLSSWLPYYGAYVLPVDTVDVYAFRSALAPMTMLAYDLRRRDVDWRPLKQLTEEWRRITGAGYFYGDYYPLTPYNRDDTQWIAWQFHRPDLGTGLVQAFRRKNSHQYHVLPAEWPGPGGAVCRYRYGLSRQSRATDGPGIDGIRPADRNEAVAAGDGDRLSSSASHRLGTGEVMLRGMFSQPEKRL